MPSADGLNQQRIWGFSGLLGRCARGECPLAESRVPVPHSRWRHQSSPQRSICSRSAHRPVSAMHTVAASVVTVKCVIRGSTRFYRFYQVPRGSEGFDEPTRTMPNLAELCRTS